MADLSSMGAKSFLKVQDIQATFKAEVQEVYIQPARGEFNAQVIMVTEKYKIPLNAINVDTLRAAWGDESDNWVGKTVEVSEGEYTDKKGEIKSVTKVVAVSTDPQKITQPNVQFDDAPPVFDPNGGE